MNRSFIFFGTSSFGLPAVEALRSSGWTLTAVVTQPDRPAGRGHELQASPVSAWAETHQTPVLKFPTLRTIDAQAQLTKWPVDLYLVAAFGLIIPPEILSLPRLGSLNIHASLLPRHRGASPIAAAILAGDVQTGITVMSMSAGIDTGPIVESAAIEILNNDTAGTLELRLSKLAASTVPGIINRWEAGLIVPHPQPETGASYASKLSRADGQLKLDSAQQAARRVRAFQPWPGAWVVWSGRIVKILQATYVPSEPSEPIGTVTLFDRYPAVTYPDGLLRLDRLQLAGKKPQPGDFIARDLTGFIGSRLDAR